MPNTKKFGEYFLDTYSTMLVTAFTLVAALAWNEAIKALIRDLFPVGSDTAALFIYAGAVTLVAVVAAYSLSRFFNKLKLELEEAREELLVLKRERRH